MQTYREFERLISQFLERHPELAFEWRKVENVAGGRTDLIIWPGKELEVFASLTDSQITIGTRTEALDFESFGRDITREQLATEALTHMEALIVSRTSAQMKGERRS